MRSLLLLLAAVVVVCGQEPTWSLTASRQESVAEKDGPAKGIMGLGRAPQPVPQWTGVATTVLQFEIPQVPAGQAIPRGVLHLHFDWASKPYNSAVWAAIVRQPLPKTLTWDNVPDIVELTRTRAVPITDAGEFDVELNEGLTGGGTVAIRLFGGGGGLRWCWWRDDFVPTLDVYTGPADSVISVMHAARENMPPKDHPMPSLMPAWRQLDAVPIVQYYWPKVENPEQRAGYLADYLEMGFTGTYKTDQDPPYGGKLFVDKGLFGFMLQSNFANRGEPVLGPDGAPAPFPIVARLKARHPICNSVFSPANVECYYSYLIAFGRDYGLPNMFRVGDTYVLSSWDETGLYSRKFMEYGYTARPEFQRFLHEVVYQDETPHQDSNGDGRTFTSDTALAFADWADIPLPRVEERFERPGFWRLFVDFHGYYTYLFFRRGALVMEQAFRQPVELFAFSHATAKWPGRSAHVGLDLYWQAQLNRVLTVEDCQADYPGSNIHYAWTDQLSRRYDLPVMGWSWFWPEPDKSNDPLEIGRALARALSHSTHGLNFWVYGNTWKEKPEARAAVAHWHRIFQAQWPFLRTATVPAPRVAVVRAKATASIYPGWEYPKLDYGWTVAALTEAHIDFEVIADNQVEREPEILKDYDVLLIPTATWESPAFRREIAAFTARGGFVYTTGDSFMMDAATGATTDFLATAFGVNPAQKYKGLFAPSYDSPAEYFWRHEQATPWQTAKYGGERHVLGDPLIPLEPTAADLAKLRQSLPETSGTGLRQKLLDPMQPHYVLGAGGAALPAKHRTFHDIVTGTPVGAAKVLATYAGQPCAIETERTVWLGFRPGFDHACVFPLDRLREWGEPPWPFAADLSQDAAGRADARAWITYVLTKAGIAPRYSVTRGGAPAPDIEIRDRADAAGNRLVFVINHETNGAPLRIASPGIATAGAVAELRGGRALKIVGGAIEVTVPAKEVAILAVGTPAFVAARQAAQDAIKKDVAPMVTF